MESLRDKLDEARDEHERIVEELRAQNKAIKRESAKEIAGLKSQIAVLESNKQRVDSVLERLSDPANMRKFSSWLSNILSDYSTVDPFNVNAFNANETLRMMGVYCVQLQNKIDHLESVNKDLSEKRHFFRR